MCKTEIGRSLVRLRVSGNLSFKLLYLISETQLLLAGVVGVALTGFLLDSAGASAIIGWWQAFAACAVQCLAGAVLFVVFAKGNRIFGSDTDS